MLLRPGLRPYQLAGVSAIQAELTYRRSTLRVAATGTGKTAEIAAVAKLHLLQGGERVVVTAPREELLDQAEAWIKRMMPELLPSELGREQADQRAHAGNRIVLASVPSLTPDRVPHVPAPTLWIADEAHLYYDALTELVAGPWGEPKRVGFTATPDRLDQLRLVPRLYESVAHVYGVKQAIEQGFLVPIRAVEVRAVELPDEPLGPPFGEQAVELLDDGIREADVGALRAIRESGAVEKVAAGVHRYREGRQTILFAVDLDHAERLAGALLDLGERAEAISGAMGYRDRSALLAAFRAGDPEILVSVVLLTYGVDAPECSCIALARPTMSRALACQMIGRGLRLHPGKQELLVLDFSGTALHHRLVTPAEALEPDWSHLEEHAAKAAADPPRGDGAGARSSPENVEESLLGAIPRDSGPVSAYTGDFEVIELTHLLEPLGIDPGARQEGEGPATVSQRSILAALGLDVPGALGSEQAARIIEGIEERRRSGYCTLRQALYLQRRGLNPQVSFEIATKAIHAIKRAWGKVPRALKAQLPELIYRGSNPLRTRYAQKGQD